jgi:hypothetical protein
MLMLIEHSTKEQAYTVSDCTAEGLKSVLYLQELEYVFDLRFTTARLRILMMR